MMGFGDIKLDLDKRYISAEEVRSIAQDYISKGVPVILGHDNFKIILPDGSSFMSPHWVVVVGFDDYGYYVNNPSFGTADRIAYNEIGRQFEHIIIYVKQ